MGSGCFMVTDFPRTTNSPTGSNADRDRQVGFPGCFSNAFF